LDNNFYWCPQVTVIGLIIAAPLTVIKQRRWILI
jgi:hypothetical protein